MYLAATQRTSDLWWKNATIYCMDVETFMDSDGDGVGDFAGATQRLDYLVSLGVNCLWLLPFYPTPNRDDGYDITDFYAVDPRFGSLGDFVTFRRAAGEHGIRVIIDLVGNHTSDEHPWFQDARSGRDAVHRDWYVWADEPIEEAVDPVFPGRQRGNWTRDETTGQYYFHRFYDFQPDLNIANPQVREELYKIMGFWLELGVSGFRLDAVPFVIETVGVEGPPGARNHELLRQIRSFVSRRSGDAVLIGEANVEPADMAAYFGGERGDEMHMLFNYSLSAALMLALARQHATPLRRHLYQLPAAPDTCTWLNYARIHDEINLERLAEDEQQEVLTAFAPAEDMRAYGRGLRRRVAPVLDGDRRRIELAYSAAFSAPGTPLLLYGDEIGMGDDLSLPDRLSVRTVMQWSAEASAGFSTSRELVRPVIRDGPFSYDRVNVDAQRKDEHSLMAWMRRALTVRRESPEVGVGEWRLLDVGDEAVLAHRCDWGEQAFIALHNFSPEPRSVALDLGDLKEVAVVLSDEPSAHEELDARSFKLEGYAYRWLRANTGEARVLL